LAQYLHLARWIDNVPEHYVLVRDPKDSKYLNLAVEANAPYLVTTDLDLLDLMDPQSTVGIDFRNRFPAVQVVTPAEFENLVHKAGP
jgi:predicted nucleic acid-binding protein